MPQIAVIGAGIFGASAALELVRRGADVALLDAGPIPHPLAERSEMKRDYQRRGRDSNPR